MNMKLLGSLAAFGLLALSGVASADAFDAPAAVTLWNESGLAIDEFYMSTNGRFGDDLLGDSVLPSGYHATVEAGRGRYDVKLVDEDGDKCVVTGVRISGDRRLTLTPDMLLRCEGYHLR